MEFYRPATEKDFQDYLKLYDFRLKNMSRAVSLLCTKDIEAATELHWKQQHNMTWHDASVECQIYARYAEAKSDYNKGIKVYVKY